MVRAQSLASNTEEVLSSLGIDAEQLSTLRANGVNLEVIMFMANLPTKVRN